MENIITRHRNLSILVAVLFAQVLGLAFQVHKTTERGSDRLIRVWAVSAITPFEKAVVHTASGATDLWHNYFFLRNVARENDQLRQEIQQLRLQQVRMAEDASQARRLQTLLGFKEQFISQTMAAQVISTTGSDFSRGIYIDKGTLDGIKADMPVITPDGIVGKVLRAYPTSSLVLEISDPSSGAGVILEKSRLQGILKGSSSGVTSVANVMADEKVEPGERVLTSGGDRIYPKGLAVGAVSRVNSAGTFLNVEVRPAARLNRLEEVLVITKVVEKAPDANEPNGPVRAIDILADRLPSVPQSEAESKYAIPPTTAELAARAKQAAQAAAAGANPAGEAKSPAALPAVTTPLQKQPAKAAAAGPAQPAVAGATKTPATPAASTPASVKKPAAATGNTGAAAPKAAPKKPVVISDEPVTATPVVKKPASPAATKPTAKPSPPAETPKKDTPE